MPILAVALYDAKRVDPDVFDADGLCKAHKILKRSGQIFERDAFLMALEICRRCAKRLLLD